MYIIKKSNFVKSAVVASDYPDPCEAMEFAFVGRSNVGKSSIINSLTNRRQLARTSKTPGRTQLINFFHINDRFYIVDLPGYGFAKVPKKIKIQWNEIISKYLISNRKKLVFVLLDIRRVPSDEDMEMLEWLDTQNIPIKIIFTKIDKLSNNEMAKSLAAIRKKLSFDKEDVFFHSSLSNKGRENILDFIGKNVSESVEDMAVDKAAENQSENIKENDNKIHEDL